MQLETVEWEDPKGKHVSTLPAGRQLVYYFQYLYRIVFAYLIYLYIERYGFASGWLPYEDFMLLFPAYVVSASILMGLSRSRRLAMSARYGLMSLDLLTLAVGVPFDPNPGIPLLFLFYIGFLEVGLRYGLRAYLVQACAGVVAMVVMISLRALCTDTGFSLLDAWQTSIFLFILLYGLQVFALRERDIRALRETRDRLQLSMEAPGVCAWFTDSPLLKIEIDGNLKRILGVELGEYSDSMTEFVAQIHPDDRDRVTAGYTDFVSHNASNYEAEYRIVRKDGVVIPISSRARARRDKNGRALTVSGMVWDLSDQKRQQEALLKMEERYRLATRSAKVGAWVWNVKEGTSEVDEFLGTIFGFPENVQYSTTKPAVNQTDFLSVVHPEDRKQLSENIAAALASTSEEYVHEYRILLNTGEVRGIRSRGTIFRDEQGKAIRVAGVTWDATQLVEARRALEQKTLELERSNKELDDFSYIASHDLKEPLRGIANYVQFLEEDYADRLDDKGRSMLQKMREQAKRMETLIMQLLNVARLSRSQMTVENTNLQATLDEIIASLEFSINEKKIQIRIPRRLPNIRCDHVRVGELFRNLITNGMKYNDKTNPWLEIGYDGSKTGPIFYVRDNGIGIKPEHHQQIFTIFQRLHTRDAYGGGTGVGMTIAQKIVQMHGGRIWLDSEPGVGTTFYFTLEQGVAT